MSLLDAIIATGVIPGAEATQQERKRYSEVLSRNLAVEVADGLRRVGFPRVKPERGGPQEKTFQGGLGPKKVDVTYSDEQHGLIFAVSIKTITAPPYGKNLKNRFYDLCPEAITLHMRFPYSIVCALFAFPVYADHDHSTVAGRRQVSTFRRAMHLFSTITGRDDYTGPGEKFENITMMLFQPVEEGQTPSFRLFEAVTRQEFTEEAYFTRLVELHNERNPHALIDMLEDDSENELDVLGESDDNPS